MRQSSTTAAIEEVQVHPWLKRVAICFVPGPGITPLTQELVDNLLRQFDQFGHVVQDEPDEKTDIILTTAPYGEPLPWRKSIALTGRMRFNYKHTPTIFTLVNITPGEFESKLNYFEKVLAKEKAKPEDYKFPGLAPTAYTVLYEQGNRGGPILALERLLQAQTKSLRVLMLVGNARPVELYHFDLVGAYPASPADDLDSFIRDIVLRMVTSVSTHEITSHEVVGDKISRGTWQSLDTPAAMRFAARKFGELNFFTEMVVIDKLVKVPVITDAVASQYSEGCFATWDPYLEALVTTITGSARPVDKSSLSDDDLAIITGVRADRKGALVRHVQGKRNDPPSSEAVELIDMDSMLPKIGITLGEELKTMVPIARSKLHGHRGISSYNPDLVEFAHLDPPYYEYPVTCATEAQANGIKNAFARSEALNNPDDPRQVVFTVLPTHGVVIVEKWNSEKTPFQTIWEYIEGGQLVVDNLIPQGAYTFELKSGRMALKEL